MPTPAEPTDDQLEAIALEAMFNDDQQIRTESVLDLYRALMLARLRNRAAAVGLIGIQTSVPATLVPKSGELCGVVYNRRGHLCTCPRGHEDLPHRNPAGADVVELQVRR